MTRELWQLAFAIILFIQAQEAGHDKDAPWPIRIIGFLMLSGLGLYFLNESGVAR